VSRYRCHLRRRNGLTQTEIDTHHGAPPRVGAVVNVALLRPGVAKETIPARVKSLSVDPDNADGDPITHVYMDEIASG
jgi:hypothetical protein